MKSIAQLLANRRNAKRSTGPKTEAGKMRSSRNAFRHGLRTSQCITVIESTAEYRELHAALFAEWQPRNLTEELEVDRLTNNYWNRSRAEAALNEALDSEICSAIETKADAQLRATGQDLERLAGSDREDRKLGKKARRMQRRYNRILELQSEVKMRLGKNSAGVGAALCRLGAQGDKLSTLMRYLSHWEREVQRSIETLRRLRGD